MSCVGTYSPEFLDVIISNNVLNHVLTGFADGTFVSIEPFEDRITPTYGAKGEAYRAMHGTRAFTINVTLSQTSHSNDVLTYLLANDLETLDGTFTITVKDSSGTTLMVDRCAYIGTEPTQAFSGGGTIESREWSIHAVRPSYVIGGNSRFTPEEVSAVEALGQTVDPQWSPQ